MGHARERFSNRKIVFTDYVSKNFGACGAAYRAFFEYNVMYTIVRKDTFGGVGVLAPAVQPSRKNTFIILAKMILLPYSAGRVQKNTNYIARPIGTPYRYTQAALVKYKLPWFAL